jgi:Protein of unknown function (DUF4235)
VPRVRSGIHTDVKKVLFVPISVGTALTAGFVAQKIFDQIWELFDQEEAPDSKHRDIDVRKLIAAAAVQGAVFRVVKEASDHYARRGFANVTGSWPGEERPEPE